MSSSLVRAGLLYVALSLSACGGGTDSSTQSAAVPTAGSPLPVVEAPAAPAPDGGMTPDTPVRPDSDSPVAPAPLPLVRIDLTTALWTIEDLTDIAPEDAFLNDINDSGDILGTTLTAQDVPPGSLGLVTGSRAFVLHKSSHLPLNGSYVGVKINNTGQIAVSLWDKDNQIRWNPSEELSLVNATIETSPLNLVLPPGTFSLQDMNNRGEMLGTYASQDWSSLQPFIYQQGNLVLLPPLSVETKTDARAINDQGDFVGCSYTYTPSHCEVGYVYRDESYIELGTLPDKSFSSPTDINNAGQVIGNSGNAGDNAAWLLKNFIYENGVIRELVLPGIGGHVREINDFGQIVGYRWRSSAGISQFGFVMQEDQVIELSNLPEVQAAGFTIHSAHAINNRGQILATGHPLSGGWPRLLVLTPRPASP